MTTTTYRVSRINAEKQNGSYLPERAHQIATDADVTEVRAAMQATIEPTSSDWITVTKI